VNRSDSLTGSAGVYFVAAQINARGYHAVRSREKGVIDRSEALVRLSTLARHGRCRNSIVEDARRALEEQS
jgi:hypothetical protein